MGLVSIAVPTSFVVALSYVIQISYFNLLNLLFTKARVAPVQPEEQIRATDYQINELEEQLAELL